MGKKFESLPLRDKLLEKIYAYQFTIWREKWREGIDQEWLNNFEDADQDVTDNERINMLYLLSKFMYFGNEELRQLLLSLYRDFFKYPIVESIRKANGDSTDLSLIGAEFKNELNKTRFLGVGNPSESGVHMLYYFRQECNLSKEYFLDRSEIFSTTKFTETLPDKSIREYLKSELSCKKIMRYIFIDDFCGSGTQARDYLKSIVENIKFENSNIEVNYLMLFGTSDGISNIKKLKIFNRVEAVFTLDETFKTFSDTSRYFAATPHVVIDKSFSKETAHKYGSRLFGDPLGFGDCQLLLGMSHNTPDNSLPIFWSDFNRWKPIFKRYNKIY